MTTPRLPFLKAPNELYRENYYASGTATVAAAGTTVTVTHNLGFTNYRVLLCPTVDPGGRFWVTTKTKTQFTINLSAGAPGGGAIFDWVVRKENVG